MDPPRIVFSSGVIAILPVLLEHPVPLIASAVSLPVDTYLEEVERWAGGPGLIYGLRVDREAQTITIRRPS